MRSLGMITAAAILSQAAADFNGSIYARNASLSENLDVFWTIDSELETIRVAVHAKDATGWAGFGVSEMGGMEGADIVFYEAATDSITDAHAIIPGKPITDECEQDWVLLSAEVGSDGLVFEAERALDTGDTQDRVFVDDDIDGVLPTRLLAAWGDEETISYHGATSVAKGQVILFGGTENSNTDPLIDIVSDAGVLYFDVTERNFTIPAARTRYQHACLPAADLPMLDEFHVIGFEGLVDPNTSKYVHHVVLKAFEGTDDCGQSCEEALYSPTFSSNSTSYTSSSPCDINYADVYVWAPGSASVALPDDVGFRFSNGGSSSNNRVAYRSVGVEIHYDNPDGDTGMMDNSGVRVYYTEELRPMDMGVIELGDPSIALFGEPIPDGKSFYSFGCPESCFEQYFEDESVTVFAHTLHMHGTGQRLQTRQYRNDNDGNEALVHTAEIEFYSFVQGGTHVVGVNDSVTIQKGDRFETDCYYDTAFSSEPAGTAVTFGDGSQNEMCIDFVFYYPSQNLPDSGFCGYAACDGELLDSQALEAESDFSRTFGTSLETCVEEVQATSASTTARPRLGSVASATALAVLLISSAQPLFTRRGL